MSGCCFICYIFFDAVPFGMLDLISGMYRHVTFLCGRGGLYALGAVVANLKGDQQGRNLFLNLFLEVLSTCQFSTLIVHVGTT